MGQVSDTMALFEGAGWGHQHRELTVKKVENGFEVNASFLKLTKDRNGEPYHSQDRRSFVFYTTEEALDFVKNYLEAPQAEIVGE